MTQRGMEVSEPELVERLKAGEYDAYRRLVALYGQTLYNTALRITGNSASAEDALQESYLSAYQHIHSFQARATLKTWLTRICMNASVSRLRSDNKTGNSGASLESEQMERWLPVHPSASPENELYRTELRKLLDYYLNRLSPRLREVFVLRDMEELSVEETAAILDLSESAVKTRHFRARMLLRVYLEPHLRAPQHHLAAVASPMAMTACV